MKIDVIGCGSAFSTINNTSSIIVKDNDENQWLIDCGPTVPRGIWERGIGPNEINVIYFTHIHPDHCSGLAALLNQWKSFERTEPLDIFCQLEQRKPLEQLLALAIWPENEISFEIHWNDIQMAFSWKHWQLATAKTQHEMDNCSLRITLEDQVFFYSGDGRPTAATKALMQGADMAFQECASFEALESSSSHGDYPDCVKLLVETGVQALGIYHCFDSAIPKIESVIADTDGLFLSRDGLCLDLTELKALQHKVFSESNKPINQ
ncbi:MBL fold metallo-hydrolase [Marinomonas sp. 15G1-11]|uniref:MBL fold metallo-hydrolase n=1 Tax=Marinomonas phaeophyticola TaxID=3004091 RepID=A0ABT4JWL1_9GAMM|nr:MBL fold metallo-hydrolase [Marinomonas sp. 15G1-11]MCZ2722769.1 MBL fold metallo-hydrolase [Marinomonas sp. 15G1-11]